MDKISLSRISLLHPKLVSEAINILEEVDEALSGKAFCRITQTLRTFKEQDDLYAQGRTKPGKIVTNARGGQSNHNYGLSCDFCLIVNGKEISWDTKKDYDGDLIADWMEVVAVFKKYKWSWGGDWRTFVDLPHVEKTFGYSTSQLLEKYNKKDFISGTTYLNL